MPISHTSLLAQTTKIVHLQRTWFSFLAFHNNRWIARLFTVASHKLPVSKLLYYLWNRKITKKYPSWLLPAGEPLPEKLIIQICVWEQRLLWLLLFLLLLFYSYNCSFHSILQPWLDSWPYCVAFPSRYFLHPDIDSQIKAFMDVWRSKEEKQRKKKKKSTHALLQQSATNKKRLKPFCFTMTMMNEMFLMWY